LIMSAKVLIVENNVDSRNYLAALLKIKGYTVEMAADGQEALRHSLAHHPDLIISDIMMPNLDGVQMLKALLVIPECSSIPILVVSAYGSGRLEDALQAGADNVLRKPLNCDLLLKMIGEMATNVSSSC
jgi:CheY-like chemotaxis protein